MYCIEINCSYYFLYLFLLYSLKFRWLHWDTSFLIKEKLIERHEYPNVHRSTVYNSQDMEAT